MFKNIKKNNLVFDKRISENCSDLIRSKLCIYLELLSTDIQNRIKIKDIFSHPWVKSFENSPVEKKPIESTEKFIVNNRNTTVTVARDTNGMKPEPSVMITRGLINCKETLKNELKKTIKLTTGKEEPNKIRNDFLYRDSSNIFDKVLKKVDEKAKS